MTTTPSGGDNPAHPYLMMSLRDALLNHGAIIHYARGFWNGFELFQFYFPFPYICGALLSTLVHPSIAFKTMVILGAISLPYAFGRAAKAMGASIFVQIVASLLSLCFLYTEAHVMWGGNIFSNAAGMIANQWGVTLFVLSFAFTVENWNRSQPRFRILHVLLYAATALSHFYCLLMVLCLFGAFFITDLIERRRWLISRPGVVFYLQPVMSLLLISWWFIPLRMSMEWSSEFGGAWEINLFTTYTPYERWTFALSLSILLVAVALQIQRRLAMLGIFLVLVNAGLYFLGHSLGVYAFLEIRIWPALYLALYLATILAAQYIWIRFPKPLRSLSVVAPILLFPATASLEKSNFWFSWNWGGTEKRAAWVDYEEMIRILKEKKGARVITELGPELDGLTGSSRGFELLPYYTDAEIPIGGIVNSASFANVGYALQCLVGAGCAGMPPRTFVSDPDQVRAVNYMKTLGVEYLIAHTPDVRAQFARDTRLNVLFSGKSFSLFQLKEPARKVESYSGTVPLICSERWLTTAVNLHRWDSLRDAAVEFKSKCLPEEEKVGASGGRRISPAALFNHMVDEWKYGSTLVDRGWGSRGDRHGSKLTGFLFSYRKPFSESFALDSLFEPFIGYRSFDTELMLSNVTHGLSEVAMPLQATPPGEVVIAVSGRGYRAYLGGKELALNQHHTVSVGNDWLIFKPILSERYRTAEVSSQDPRLTSKINVPPLSFTWPERTTDACDPKLEVEMHQMTLKTKCPGHAHIVKYSYFPKWVADVPIGVGPNGFMILTPKSETTVIQHKRRPIDWASMGISLLTLIGCLILERSRFSPEVASE